MNQELLNKYFENQCTPAEIALVENWILDAKNKAEFDQYLSKKWDDHTNKALRSKLATTKRFNWKIAAAAVLILGTSMTWLIKSHQRQELPISTTSIATSNNRNSIPKSNSTIAFNASPNPKKTIQNEKKSHTNKTVAIVDTSIQKPPSKSIKASKLANFMVNEVQLAKFTNELDSGTMVMNIKANQASFQEIATILRKRYGIILEPCSDIIPTTTYTARLEKTSIPDLLNDMSEKMLFSYTIQDNLIKICFN